MVNEYIENSSDSNSELERFLYKVEKQAFVIRERKAKMTEEDFYLIEALRERADILIGNCNLGNSKNRAFKERLRIYLERIIKRDNNSDN